MCVICSQYPSGLEFIYTNNTKFHLYLTEDILITMAPWVNVFKEIITFFPDNHTKSQNAFYADIQVFHVTACGAHSSHCCSESLCHFHFTAKCNC